MEAAIASAIARRGVLVQAFQDRVQDFEVLEAAQIGFADLRTTFLCHGIRSLFAAQLPTKVRSLHKLEKEGKPSR
jgi:hypothetical protein